MGKMITLCSPCPRTGKSVIAYTLANYLNEVLNKSLKILVCSISMNNGNVLSLFNIKTMEIYLEDLVNTGYSGDKDINLGNILTGTGRIKFIGSKKAGTFFTDRQQKGYHLVIQEMKRQFDVVLIEAINNECTLSYIFKLNSDCIINVLPQDTEILGEASKHIFNNAHNISIINSNNISIINMYHDIYPVTKELEKLIPSQKVFTSPYCSMLQEMKNKGKLNLYLQHETGFNKRVHGMADHIIMQNNLLKEASENSMYKKNSIIHRLTGGRGK